MDKPQPIDEVIRQLRRFRDARDWSQFHTPKDLAISVSIEAGELLELFQWREDGHNTAALNKDLVADEAADVLLYILMLFDRLGLDPVEEALRKIAKNESRFPIGETFGKAGKF
ncbi:nucleotide pyrophosphohydrolase [Brucella intermedia]|uniref:nucleotide pyrophosphohydrolase n=1 Tax=Brucella intermedia TaxID=94625 RepID=UPI00209B06FF|nr:nucleotide pyrophosphohydrolase [Brucella intermedia]MCO7729107.1 nucleotide pyrophosphohydrolase [Brucella intermedia]